MESSVFKPRYTLFVYALIALYAAPWLYSLPNAAFGHSSVDWKLFWLLAGSVWAFAGLLHMKSILVKKITFSREITIEMSLQKPFFFNASEAVRIYGETFVFSGYIVMMRYFSNSGDLLRFVTSRADRGRLNLIYDEHGRKDAGWSVEKNLIFLIIFAFYMMAIFTLRLRPIHLIGPATDSLLLGWAVLLPVLLTVKLFRVIRERSTRREEEP